MCLMCTQAGRGSGVATPTGQFPTIFTLKNTLFMPFAPGHHESVLAALAATSFSLLHRGRLDDTSVRARIAEDHRATQRQTNNNPFFGGRMVASGAWAGCYSVVINHLPTRNMTIDASIADFILHNDAGAESGLADLMLDDLGTRAAQWATQARGSRCLAILVGKEALRPVLQRHGFTPANGAVKTKDFGSVALYSKVYKG